MLQISSPYSTPGCLLLWLSLFWVCMYVWNKCVTCLWEMIDRGPLGYFWTVGLLPQILKVVWPAPLISFTSFSQLFICKGLSILVPFLWCSCMERVSRMQSFEWLFWMVGTSWFNSLFSQHKKHPGKYSVFLFTWQDVIRSCPLWCSVFTINHVCFVLNTSLFFGGLWCCF